MLNDKSDRCYTAYDRVVEYGAIGSTESQHRGTILSFLQSHHDPFDRAHLHAHLTGSALIVSFDGTRVLLGYHRKLSRWLQMGGHGEPGETDPLVVAMREAREESGVHDLRLDSRAPAPIDVDVHTIPARCDVPEHLHLDIRFLLRAPADAAPACHLDEQDDLRWFLWDEVEYLELDPSLVRLIAKARGYARA
ncbi:MAG: NUDIX hydrolase [Candidatus Sumerlaeaceae bacterium]